MIMFVEIGWYGLRPLTRLILSGAMERHPNLKFAFTETGNSWIPEQLDLLDMFYKKAVKAKDGSVESFFGAYVRESLSLTPSEYWARQCFLGASFMSPADCAVRERVGLDQMMWGADYPHTEGTHPYTFESLRATFAGVPRDQTERILGTNAARAYGFDLKKLGRIAAQVGPLAKDLERGIRDDEIPSDAVTMAFTGERPRN
jgi:predicted TIM-barrel fold metal-dependent hydrolase